MQFNISDNLLIDNINNTINVYFRCYLNKYKMAGTYSQLYIQMVFAVKYRMKLVAKEWKDELYKYISGVITNKGQKSIIVNGMPDHIHIFVGLRPALAIADLVRDIKNNSSNFINDNNFIKGKFEWQGGYGAFSYSHSHIDRVYNYILNQEQLHKNKSFRKEYMELLDEFDVRYEEKYLFEWI